MRRPATSGLGYHAAKIEFYGAAVEVGSGSVAYVQLGAYARRTTEDRPYGVANDYVSSMLGCAIGAPVPPGVLINLGREWGYASIGFGQSGQRPPPADLQDLAVSRPWEATGIIVLDQWILNTDRHDENLAFLPDLGVAAFDHDAALFGPRPPDVAKSLEDGLHRRVVKHPLAEHLQDARHFSGWFDRVRSVSPEEIRRLAFACCDAKVITATERDCLIPFVVFRQSRIAEYVERSREDFVALDAWPLPQPEGDMA